MAKTFDSNEAIWDVIFAKICESISHSRSALDEMMTLVKMLDDEDECKEDCLKYLEAVKVIFEMQLKDMVE